MGGEIGVDRLAQRVDRRPLRIAVRLGDARILVHARDVHRNLEIDVAHVGVADDRRGIARIGGARERDVPFAGEKPRGRIEADPAGAGKVHLGPGVQVGEIALGSGGAVERLLTSAASWIR